MKPVASRRALVSATATLLAAITSGGPPLAAKAGPPLRLTSLPAGSRLRESLELSLRPKVRALPRRQMQMDFAVMLMRAGYAVTDDLDFIAMNQFQKDFFVLRQGEWDRYRQELPNLQQGDLSNPSYFDFISFCQHATIAAEMRTGSQIFEELIDAEGTSQVVTRPPELADNAALPAAHAERVGNLLLDKISEKYTRLSPKVPPPTQQVTAALVIDGVRQIAEIFEINDYMLSQRVTPLANGFELAMVVPATLWSQQVLQLRGELPNDYEAKVVSAWLRRCSVPATYTTRIDKSTEVIHTFTWPAGLLARGSAA